MDHLLPRCPTQPQVPLADFREAWKQHHRCLCYWQNTAPHSLSLHKPDCSQDRSHATNKEGKKNTFNSMYLYIHTYIPLLIIRPLKLQISPEMQKYGLYTNEKTHTCFKCHANSIVVMEVMQCQLQLPCFGVARWKCLRRECDPWQTTAFFWLSDSILEFSEGCVPKG